MRNNPIGKKIVLFISSQIHSNDDKQILVTGTLTAWEPDLSQL